MPARSTRNAPAAAPPNPPPTRSSRRLRSSADVAQSPLRALSPPRRATRGKKRAAPVSDESEENRPPKRVDTRSRGKQQSTSEELTTEKSSGEKSSSSKTKSAKPKAAASSTTTTKKPRKVPNQNKYATRDAITRSLRSNTQKQKADEQASKEQMEKEEVHRLYNISLTPFNSSLNKSIDIYVDPPEETTSTPQPKQVEPSPSPPKPVAPTPSQPVQSPVTPSSSRWNFVFGPVSKFFGLSRTTASAPTTPKNDLQTTSPPKVSNPRTEPRPAATRNPSNIPNEQQHYEASAAPPPSGDDDSKQSTISLPYERPSEPASELPTASPSDTPSSPFGDVARTSPLTTRHEMNNESGAGDYSPILGRQTTSFNTPRLFQRIKSPFSHQQPERAQSSDADNISLSPTRTAPQLRRFFSRTPRHLKTHAQRMRERREADAKKVADAERKKLEIVAEEDLRLKAEARQFVQKAREEAEKKQVVGEKRKKVRIDDLELIPSGPPGTFSLLDKYFEQGSSSEDELDEDEVARDAKDEDTTQPRAAKRVRFSDASTSRLNVFQTKTSPSPYAAMHAPYPTIDEAATQRPDPYAYAQKHHVWIGEKPSSPERPADFNWEGHFAVPDDSDTETEPSVLEAERDEQQQAATSLPQADKPTTPGPDRTLPPGKGLKYKALSDGSLVLMEYDLPDTRLKDDKTSRANAQSKTAETSTPPETPRPSTNIFAQAEAKIQAEQAAANAQAEQAATNAQAEPKTPDASKPKADTAAALQKAAAAANKHQPKTPSKLREVSRYSSPITSEDAAGKGKGAAAAAAEALSSSAASLWPVNIDPSLQSAKAAIRAAPVAMDVAASDWLDLDEPIDLVDAMRQYMDESAAYKDLLEPMRQYITDSAAFKAIVDEETQGFHDLALSLVPKASAPVA